VHGAWGISDVYPDTLIWHDIRDSTAMAPEMFAMKHDKEGKIARMIEEQKRSLGL